MDLLNVALQVIAIIAIIAVGAFIIVFLSDLLISIIDNHQGIFFRRGKGRSETHENTYNYNYTENNIKSPAQTGKSSLKTFDNFDFNDDFTADKDEQIEIIPTNPFKKKFVDLDAAAKEQAMVEKARSNFFDEEEQDEEPTEEEKAAKDRMARLEERNKQLEEELKAKETKKDSPKFDDIMPGFKDEDLDDEDEDEDDDLEGYEALIKKINQEVKQDFDKGSGKKLNLIDEDEQDEDEQDEDEEDEDDNFEDQFVSHAQKQKDADNLSDLEKQISELKAQLEEERKQAEQLKKEAEEKAITLLEEKKNFEATIKEQSDKAASNEGGVTFASEEEYVARLETLEERLREAKKELRNNKREFVPLNKIKRTLEKDQVKLRRKEAQVAKAKVALFGVNNNDIDPKKQAELEQEIDMLEGLKLSVQHCEDVMRENEDRYPILEQTHNILTKNVNNLTADIELIEKKLKQIRAKK